MWMTAWNSGVVSFESREDVELAAEWSGEPGGFVSALLEERWLDETELGLEIHDWWDHAPDYVRKRKDMLLLALSRGYNDIRSQWLRDRHISSTNSTPTVDQRSTIGPLSPILFQPNPTNTNSKDTTIGTPPEDKPKKKRFFPPDVEEIKMYLEEIKESRFTAQAFHDHYAKQGWKLGNGRPVSDWKACIRTWRTKRDDSGSMQTPQPQEQSLTDTQRINRQLISERIEHDTHPLWPKYRAAVIAKTIQVGWEAYLGSQHDSAST
jgi:hypothetical protein